MYLGVGRADNGSPNLCVQVPNYHEKPKLPVAAGEKGWGGGG